MSSDYFPESVAEAYERFEFDFPARPLEGRLIALVFNPDLSAALFGNRRLTMMPVPFSTP